MMLCNPLVMRHTQYNECLLIWIRLSLLRWVLADVDAVAHIHQSSQRAQVSQAPQPSQRAPRPPLHLLLHDRVDGIRIPPPEGLPQRLLLYPRRRTCPRALHELAVELPLLARLADCGRDTASGNLLTANGCAEGSQWPRYSSRSHCSRVGEGRVKGGWEKC